MVRGLLRVYGGRVEPGAKSAATFRERVVQQLLLIQDHEGINLRPRILPILDLCERLQIDAARIESELEALAGENPVCRRFMAIPGVGAITALSFFTAIEEPTRFHRADDVAAYLGLTPRVYQSGESLTRGSISKMGNRLTRTHLVKPPPSCSRRPRRSARSRTGACGSPRRSGSTRRASPSPASSRSSCSGSGETEPTSSSKPRPSLLIAR